MADYGGTSFRLSEDRTDTIDTSIYSSVDAITPFATPRRIVMVAQTPGKLIENNDIILNLNPAYQLDDTDWIRPVKTVRDMNISTNGVKACMTDACNSFRNFDVTFFDLSCS